MTEENKQNKEVVVSKKVRDIIKCSNCKRHRSMSVNANLNHNLKETPVEVKENGEYTRGGTLKILVDLNSLFTVNQLSIRVLKFHTIQQNV